MVRHLVMSEREAVELVAYLVTSARLLLHEAKDYGPMRLLEASRRLSSFVQPHASEDVKPLLKMLEDEIPLRQREARENPESYAAFLDECCRTIAREIKQWDAESDDDHE